MKKLHAGEKNFLRFFSGKGFYIALAISLVAIGGAAWLGVNSAINKLENEAPELNETVPQQNNEWDIPDERETEVPESNVTTDKKVEEVAEPKPPVIQDGYILPLKGNIIVDYSGDKVIKSKTLDEWVMHTGVDIAAKIGTPVKAMSSGKVLEVKNDDMWGTTVTIEHANGIISYYANLKSAVNVKPGQQVKMGDVIGSVGNTCEIESAEESHLHFGVKKNGEWINPMSLIK